MYIFFKKYLKVLENYQDSKKYDVAVCIDMLEDFIYIYIKVYTCIIFLKALKELLKQQVLEGVRTQRRWSP